MVKLLKEELSFEQNQSLVRAVVEKVVATPTEATIYGRILVLEGINKSLISINESKKCKNLRK